jgi:hypothetical protein
VSPFSKQFPHPLYTGFSEETVKDVKSWSREKAVGWISVTEAGREIFFKELL